ncbi:SDCG3 protein, partial [Centropus bengalensis]|nr:SDCG3 protein [Centropus bengalensis]
LKEENALLRSKINKLQIFSETQADKLRKLERTLKENKIKEEKEAQDLEAMVQHVEQNLQLMTKRAVKAETSATKLKQENALLQVQLNNYRTENEALRSGQLVSLATVKQNADLALQKLLAVLTTSRSSIKQLVSGAESLQLVADLLKSIDRISEAPEDGQ